MRALSSPAFVHLFTYLLTYTLIYLLVYYAKQSSRERSLPVCLLPSFYSSPAPCLSLLLSLSLSYYLVLCCFSLVYPAGRSQFPCGTRCTLRHSVRSRSLSFWASCSTREPRINLIVSRSEKIIGARRLFRFKIRGTTRYRWFSTELPPVYCEIQSTFFFCDWGWFSR